MVGADVAAVVELEVELADQSVMLRMLEPDRDQDQVGLEHELAPGHRRQVA